VIFDHEIVDTSTYLSFGASLDINDCHNLLPLPALFIYGLFFLLLGHLTDWRTVRPCDRLPAVGSLPPSRPFYRLFTASRTASFAPPAAF
jgi:hypothetical protein